jgi:hypothetical protein
MQCSRLQGPAKPARTIRVVKHELQTILLMVQTRCLGISTRSTQSQCEVIEALARFDDCSSAPTCGGRKRGQDSQGFGRSRGCVSTRFHVTASDGAQSIKLHLTEGEHHDLTCAEVLLEGLKPKQLIADKGYDNDLMGQRIRSADAKPVISLRRNWRTRGRGRQRCKLRKRSAAVHQPT